MAIYVGETVAIRAVATDPFSGEALVDLTGFVEVFVPGLQPKTTPADRTPSQGSPYPVTYDAAAGGYVAYIDTTGFTDGKWSFRVELTGTSYDGWEYGSFKLVP